MEMSKEELHKRFLSHLFNSPIEINKISNHVWVTRDNEASSNLGWKTKEDSYPILKEIKDKLFQEELIVINNKEVTVSAKNIFFLEYNLLLKKVLSDVFSNNRDFYLSLESNEMWNQKKSNILEEKENIVKITPNNISNYFNEMHEAMIKNSWMFNSIRFTSSKLPLSDIIILFNPSIYENIMGLDQKEQAGDIIKLLNESQLDKIGINKIIDYYLKSLNNESVFAFNDVFADSLSLIKDIREIGNDLIEHVNKLITIDIVIDKEKTIQKLITDKFSMVGDEEIFNMFVNTLSTFKISEIEHCSREESEYFTLNMFWVGKMFERYLNVKQFNVTSRDKEIVNNIKLLALKSVAHKLATEYVGDKTIEAVELWYEKIDSLLEKKHKSYMKKMVFRDILFKDNSLNNLFKETQKFTLEMQIPMNIFNIIFEYSNYTIDFLKNFSEEQEEFSLFYNEKILKMYFYSHNAFAEVNDIEAWLKTMTDKFNNEEVFFNNEKEDMLKEEFKTLIREFMLKSNILYRQENNLLNNVNAESVQIKKKKKV